MTLKDLKSTNRKRGIINGPIKKTFTPKNFWNRLVRKPSGCWEWPYRTRNFGYGGITINGRTLRAHRIAYVLTFGAIAKGMLVCHHCDNPPCCNPSHLFLGRQLDNRRDCISKGRWRYAVGEENGLSKLTANQVIEIRLICSKGKLSDQEVANLFKIDRTTILGIRLGKSWKHLLNDRFNGKLPEPEGK